MDNEFGFGEIKTNIGSIALLMATSLGVGLALYRTFSPAERARRLRVDEAVRHADDLSLSCRKQVSEARENVRRIKRGELVKFEPLRPCKERPCRVVTAAASQSEVAYDRVRSPRKPVWGGKSIQSWAPTRETYA